MAWPMLDWVLENYYPHDGPGEMERSVRVFHARESDLVRLMDELSVIHTRAKIFSLPHMAENYSIELGFRGEQAAVDAAFTDLVTALTSRALAFDFLNEKNSANALSQAAV